MKTKEEAKQELLAKLDLVGLPIRASYRRGEVCKILSICSRTFWDMLERFEPGPDGSPRRPDSLDSHMLTSERRVPFDELVNYFTRNNSYTRRNYSEQHQLSLF